MDARSVLGLQSLRPPLLDHLPTAGREETRNGAGVVTRDDIYRSLSVPYSFDDEDDPEDEDDDRDEDDNDDEDEDEEDPDVETWQVTNRYFPLKSGVCLTSRAELPRLSRKFRQSSADGG
jgi:hypothetical protein